jgi:two-component system, chemotaxis family, protein-glutamate methylesterase/glutaminase
MSRLDLNQPLIRVMVVDDSATVRGLLVALFQDRNDMQVVATASNGDDAVRIVRRIKPDVVTMDINLPGINGLEATRRIMRETPTPIVIVSSSMMHTETELTFQALQAGALSVALTPGINDPRTGAQLVDTVRLMAGVSVVRRWGPKEVDPPVVRKRSPLPYTASLPDLVPVQMIGIAASTGGPGTLASILKPLPADYPIPIVVVQHITTGFGVGLASWLESVLALPVKLAGHGVPVIPGAVYLAPDDYHAQINPHSIIELTHDNPENGVRPSANYLFRSLANNYGPHALGIILTGMGSDGVDGLAELHRAGGFTIAQNEQSCVVYGMPHEAVKRQIVDHVLAPDEITAALLRLAQDMK